MSEERGVAETAAAARHPSLLQPIRDLAENWAIDIAHELEDYLHEIEALRFAFEGASDTFNFAEAALMIQGSACIYSKKVEYLYRLVYETLDLLATRKARHRPQASSISAAGDDADATELLHKQMEEFLELDDIKEATNITLAEGGRVAKLATIDRVPASMMALEESSKGGDPALLTAKGEVIGNRSDFCMNTSIVHDSGALLLGEDDARYIDNTFHNPNAAAMAASASAAAGVGFVPPQFEDGAPGMDYDGDDSMGGGLDADEPMAQAQARTLTAAAAAAAPPTTVTMTKQTFATHDPWKPLDPHDAGMAEDYRAPFKRLTTYRIPAQLTRQRKVEDKSGKSGKAAAAAAAPPPPPVEPLASFFDKMEKSSRSRRSRLAVEATGAFVELQLEEDARRAQRAKEDRKAAKAAAGMGGEVAGVTLVSSGGSKQAGAMTVAAADPIELSRVDMGMDLGGGGEDDFAEEAYVATGDFGDMDAPDVRGFEDNAPLGHAAVPSYEELVQQYINKFVAEADRFKKETDLSRRLKDWEDKIQPVLDHEEKRTPFDIYVYSDSILAKLPTDHKHKDQPQPLSALVESPSLFEVCRTFLAALQLANAGNVELIRPEDDGGVSAGEGVRVKLLSLHQHREDLQAFRAPSLQAV